MQPSEKPLPELAGQAKETSRVIDKKNGMITFVKNQDPSMTALVAVLERVRQSGEELGRISSEMETGYNEKGEVDGLLLENAQKELSRFQLGIEDAGNAAGDVSAKQLDPFFKKKRSLTERAIETQANFSKIAMALAGMGNETVQQAIGGYQRSLQETLKAEDSLRRTFQNLIKSNQK